MAENNKSKLNLWEKLSEIKSQIDTLSKNEESGKGKFAYKYVSGPKVLGVLNPLLAQHRVLIYPEVNQEAATIRNVEYAVKDYDNGGDKIKHGFLYEIPITMNIINAENPTEIIRVPWMGYGENGVDKGYGSALTYAERYFILKFFNIATPEDDPDNKEQPLKTVSKPLSGSGTNSRPSGKVAASKPTKVIPTPEKHLELIEKFKAGELTLDQIQTYYQPTPEQHADFAKLMK